VLCCTPTTVVVSYDRLHREQVLDRFPNKQSISPFLDPDDLRSIWQDSISRTNCDGDTSKRLPCFMIIERYRAYTLGTFLICFVGPFFLNLICFVIFKNMFLTGSPWMDPWKGSKEPVKITKLYFLPPEKIGALDFKNL
jgi:hypothetical protein